MLPLLYVPGISSRLLSDSLGVHIPERVSDEIAQPLTRDKLVSKYQMKRDTLFLSDIGKQMRLHISEQDTPDKIADASWSNVTNSRFNKHLQLYDKHISKAGELLEQMKEIAEAAQDASLDDLDRINLQIEMGQLQHELDTETDVMIGMVRHQFE
ncbi:MAG: hypothetical protein LBI74_01825, partial [Synergistaceae bacterium]|nr:hypothetical protein [Synergistaceae bacterium]